MHYGRRLRWVSYVLAQPRSYFHSSYYYTSGYDEVLVVFAFLPPVISLLAGLAFVSVWQKHGEVHWPKLPAHLRRGSLRLYLVVGYRPRVVAWLLQYPASSRALRLVCYSEALERIAGLYAIEKEIRGLSAEERRAVRQDKGRPIIDDLQPWLRAKLALISQKTKLAQAIRYALSRWNGLIRFLDDGRIEIDSNVVERSIRPIALNRKNALFAGSDGGGEHWAVIASLIETCKLNGVDPHAYLTDVITKIVNGHPNSRIDELLPWTYSTAQPLKEVA